MWAELRYLQNSTRDVILQDSTGIQSITSTRNNRYVRFQCFSMGHTLECSQLTRVHVNDIQYLSRYRPETGGTASGSFLFFFTLAVDFGELRRTCQVIQNSKFFQVIFKQPRTEQNVDKQRTKQ